MLYTTLFWSILGTGGFKAGRTCLITFKVIMQQRFEEHFGNKGRMKTQFEDCAVTPNDDILFILGRSSGGDSRLLPLEALFIKELAPVFNSRTSIGVELLL